MVIYKTINKVNGKFYIGQDMYNRPEYIGSGFILKRAIKVYGRDSFEKIILEHCNTKEELNQREKYWIEKTNAVELGYNIATGGQGGNLGPIVAKKKSKALKKFKMENPEFLVGKNNPNYNSETYHFYNIKTCEEFIGTKYELAQKLGSRSSDVSAIALEKRKRHKNWILYKNKELFTEEYLKITRTMNNPNFASDFISLINTLTGETYEGPRSGLKLKYPEINTSLIGYVIKGKRNIHRGWKLRD